MPTFPRGHSNRNVHTGNQPRRFYSVSASFAVLAHSHEEADELVTDWLDREEMIGGGWTTVETDEYEGEA